MSNTQSISEVPATELENTVGGQAAGQATGGEQVRNPQPQTEGSGTTQGQPVRPGVIPNGQPNGAQPGTPFTRKPPGSR
jgi:hypothetical protein